MTMDASCEKAWQKKNWIFFSSPWFSANNSLFWWDFVAVQRCSLIQSTHHIFKCITISKWFTISHYNWNPFLYPYFFISTSALRQIYMVYLRFRLKHLLHRWYSKNNKLPFESVCATQTIWRIGKYGFFFVWNWEEANTNECDRPTNQPTYKPSRQAGRRISERSTRERKQKKLAISPIDIGFNDFRHLLELLCVSVCFR